MNAQSQTSTVAFGGERAGPGQCGSSRALEVSRALYVAMAGAWAAAALRQTRDDAMTLQFSSSAGWRAGSLSLRRVAGRIIV